MSAAIGPKGKEQSPDLMDGVIDAYLASPDAGNPAQRVAFGTSGHRGTSLAGSFNEAHIAAIVQAVVDYRRKADIRGPLFLGRDTHALSLPAWQTALEVLVGNNVDVVIAAGDEVLATPVISHAILRHNAEEGALRADGLIITPSHNPPEDGGIKYNRLTAARQKQILPSGWKLGLTAIWTPGVTRKRAMAWFAYRWHRREPMRASRI